MTLKRLISKCIALENIIFILDQTMKGKENITTLNIEARFSKTAHQGIYKYTVSNIF